MSKETLTNPDASLEQEEREALSAAMSPCAQMGNQWSKVSGEQLIEIIKSVIRTERPRDGR